MNFELSNYHMSYLITCVLTIVSGVLVYIIGEIVQTIWLHPLQKYKEIKHDIAVSLSFYARIYTNVVDPAKCGSDEKKNYLEVSEKLRYLSCELKGYIETLSWFKCCIPSKKKLSEAADLLMSLSNSLFTPYNCGSEIKDSINNKTTEKRIYTLLGMYGSKKQQR